MNKNTILYVFILALLATTIGYFLFKGKGKAPVAKKKTTETQEFSSTQTKDSYYPDAPSPYLESSDLEDEANKLWSSAIRDRKDESHREKVRAEWRDFASKYPKNFYVLNEFKAPLTEEETKERIQSLESFTAVDSFYARAVSLGKYSPVGSTPKDPKEAGVTPNEQRAFFDFKIRELESRLELMDYAKENKGLSSDQLQSAEKDIASWKKELEAIKTVAKTVPNS
ncbi:MAG: hypothetical protein SFU98_04825 [Leptospiraceae bacterium]|nr:hypothetical protein [Leptospiraceae bacterium]